MDRDDQAYWIKVGWHANALGLSKDVSDIDVLKCEQQKRARAQGLADNASWFEIFCSEFRNGIVPTVPDYCERGDADWEDYPGDAFEPARKASQIFLSQK